ncbi:hypothetical protein [Rhodopila globiformis]|uniref:hypothetical protein n=1 Tax=Rhodopila globiformis TaxID=1071 RepID=UPI00130480F0|nr:hypothetical protein [Rhodopila globiformis]
MDRDLGKPQKSQSSTTTRAALGHADRHDGRQIVEAFVPHSTPVQHHGWRSSGHGHALTGLPMKQTTGWIPT